MNNGVFIILPYVIIYEDVLHTWIKGVDPKWLPPTNGEGITRPPREKPQKELGKWQNPEKVDVSNRRIPLKVVLESSQALDRAQVLVQASFAIPRGHAVLVSCQHDTPLITADLPQGHVHFQLKHKQRQE